MFTAHTLVSQHTKIESRSGSGIGLQLHLHQVKTIECQYGWPVILTARYNYIQAKFRIFLFYSWYKIRWDSCITSSIFQWSFFYEIDRFVRKTVFHTSNLIFDFSVVLPKKNYFKTPPENFSQIRP